MHKCLCNCLYKIDYLNKLIPNIDDLIFGGCGGNIKELLKFYLSIHGNFKENNSHIGTSLLFMIRSFLYRRMYEF